MPTSFPKKTIKQKEVHSVNAKNKIARVALLTRGYSYPTISRIKKILVQKSKVKSKTKSKTK